MNCGPLFYIYGLGSSWVYIDSTSVCSVPKCDGVELIGLCSIGSAST